jgi:hypothetical protein
MIVFDLHCSHAHAFEGWFESGDAYSDQRARQLVRCPVCDDPEIEKRLTSRVRVRKAKAPLRAKPAATPEPAPASDVAAGLPVEVLDKLREIVRNTEDVGERFAEEARRIHYEEVPARAIRGHATREEAAELHEEGIDFAALPPVLTRNTH